MSEKRPADISHLTADEIVMIIKENAAADIMRAKAELDIFMERSEEISSMDKDQIEKISTLMMKAKPKQPGSNNGGCGWFSGGCC